jgi:hypothetical protein
MPALRYWRPPYLRLVGLSLVRLGPEILVAGDESH